MRKDGLGRFYFLKKEGNQLPGGKIDSKKNNVVWVAEIVEYKLREIERPVMYYLVMK